MPADEGTAGTGGLMPYLDDERTAEARRVLARLDASAEGRATLARLDAADPDGAVAPPSPPGGFTGREAPEFPETPVDDFHGNLADRDYAGAMDAAAGRQPRGDLTAADVRDLDRMRAQPWDAPPAAPAEPDATHHGVHGVFSEGGGGTPASAGIGFTAGEAAPVDPETGIPIGPPPSTNPEHPASGHVTVNTDGEIHVQGGNQSFGGELSYDPRENNLELGVHAGDEEGTHLGLELDIENGELHGGGGELQIGSSTGSHGTLGVHLDHHARVTRAELGGRWRGSGTRKALLGGKVVYVATYGEPVASASGGYDVTVELSITVDATAGGRIRSGAELSITGGGDLREQLVRHFASQAEAQAWADSHPPELDGAVMDMLHGRLSPEDALALGIGDHQELTQGWHGGGDAELGIAALELRLRSSSTLAYDRVSPTRFRVTHRTMSGRTVAPGLDTGILSASFSHDTEERRGRVVEFDLAFAEGFSAGQQALDQALDTGQLPSGDRGPGWRVVETSEGTTVADTTTIDAMGSTGTISRNTRVDVVTDEHGNRDIRTHGGLGIAGQDNQLDVTDVLDDAGNTTSTIDVDDHGATMGENVQEEDAMSAQQALAAATGTEWTMSHGERAHPGEDGEEHGLGRDRQGGAWHANVHLSDGQMRQVFARLRRGDGARFAHLLATRANEVDTLVAAARAVASAEELRPAIAAFVTEGGPRANQFLRALAGGSVDYDLTLEGSTVFEGEAGRLRFEGNLAQFEYRFTADRDEPTLLGDVRSLFREQQQRVAQIADVDAFPLPPAVRRHELDLNRPLLERARQLLTRVENHGRGNVTATARHRNAEEMAGDASGVQESNAENHAAAEALETQSHGALAAFRGDEQRMMTARRKAVTLKQRVQAEGRIHHTPSPGNGIPPIELFTGVTGFHDADYGAAHRAVRQADDILDEAGAFYADYETLRSQVPSDGVLDAATRATVDQVRRNCWGATTDYNRAFELLEQARQRYVHIRAVNDDVRFWGQTRPPEAVR